MDYRRRFLPFDLAGGILWVSSMSLSGYFLGTLSWVKDHFEVVVLIIILLSILPMVSSAIAGRKSARRPATSTYRDPSDAG
jgi:membrane-associated protein